MVTRKANIFLYICIIVLFYTLPSSQLHTGVVPNEKPPPVASQPSSSARDTTPAAEPSQLFLSMFKVPVHPVSTYKKTRSSQNFTNSLLTDPISVEINVEEEGIFTIRFGNELKEDVEVHFECQGEKGCTTFHTELKPVLLTPTNSTATVRFFTDRAGHDVIELHVAKNTSLINLDYAFVRVRVGRSNFLHILSIVFGWFYFVGWSISFWPQNIKNYQRKSVVGLSFDYTLLHFTGMIFYSIFNCILFFSEHVQDEYEQVHVRSEIPVELNDVVYSLHAAATTSITWIQCMIYDGGNQRLSLVSKLFQGAVWVVGSALAVTAVLGVTKWLDFIYFFSYVKLIVTAVKYLPQLFFNFQRKSTAGWSIWMVYLDLSGGFMSMLQMLTLSYNFNDWEILIGNFPKLGLAIASMFYDVLFLLQEFVFYPGTNKGEDDSRAKLGIKKLSVSSIAPPTVTVTCDHRDSKISLNSYPTYGTRNDDTNNNNFNTSNGSANDSHDLSKSKSSTVKLI